MNKQQEKINKDFFNKLFFQFNTIRNKEFDVNNFKQTKHLYYSNIHKLWFAQSEDENKYYYIFGAANKNLNIIKSEDYIFFIDFSKNEEICDDCIGILTKNSLYFHENNFIKKYPNINLKEYDIKNLISLSKYNKQIKAIEIGTIDNFITFLKKIKNEHSIKMDENTSDNKTINMNLFLNAIESGKSLEQSLRISKITQKELDYWLKEGENKNKKYVEFYEKYYELVCSGNSKTANDNLMNEYYELQSKNKIIDFGDALPKKTKIKMNVFINAFKENKKLKYALKLSNLDKDQFNKWIEDGKNPNNKYYPFYIEYTKIRNTPKIKIDSEKTSNNEKLMKEFIRLKHEEKKTNKEIFETIEIPRFLIKNWRNQGQLGNKKYKEFYDAYLIDNNPKPIKNKSKTSKVDEKSKTKIKAKTITKNKERRCKICNRHLNEKHKSDLCKRCQKKQYAVKILGELLSVIKPNIPFRKDDLEVLNISKIQIKDYIWTLMEFNLIIEEKSKIKLKEIDVLNKFAEDCDSKIEINKNSTAKLSKTCKLCGKTLEISNFFKTNANEDEYEDNCRNCKKLINSAAFLKELINYIDWESEFSLDDLKSPFQDPIILQGNIWNLVENDLVINNHTSNTYTLTNEKKGNEFIEKYYQEQKSTNTTKIESSPKIQPPKNHKNKKLTKNEQIKIILNEMKNKKSRKEAAAIARIPLYKITHWYNEGRNGFGEENKKFYNELKKIEKEIQPHTKKEISLQIDNFLKAFKQTNDKELSAKEANITAEDIDNWKTFGNEKISPYDSFLREYNEIKNNDSNQDIEEYNVPINSTKRKIFLEYIRTGASIEKACEQSSLDIDLPNKWLLHGKNNIPPFNEFYKNYLNLIEQEFNAEKKNEFLKYIEKGYSKSKSSEKISDLDLVEKLLKEGIDEKEPHNTFLKSHIKSKSNIPPVSEEKIKQKIIELIENGLSLKDAAKEYENGKFEENILNWYESGKNNNENHMKFYEEVNKNIPDFFDLIKNGFSIKLACEKSNLDFDDVKNKIDKQDEEFINKLIEAKILNKIGTYPQISSTKDNERITKTMNEFLKLSVKGYSSEEICQILNLSKDIYGNWISKGISNLDETYIKFYNKLKNINSMKNEIKNTLLKSFSKDILNKLPEEYDNFISPSHSGFAWVKKTEKEWIYTRENNGKIYNYSNNDIRELFKIVINNNQIWGVRDLEKAKVSLKNPVIPKNTSQEDEYYILLPLSENIKNDLKQNHEVYISGFAWVNKINDQWIYSSTINEEVNSITAENIYELYEKVKIQNLDWGVCNLKNATYSLFENEINTDYEPGYDYKDILKPLFPEIENELVKYSKGNKSGFAWVNKSGDKWIYNRVINNKNVNISDVNIYKLYELITKNNYDWGVRDYIKAINTLENEKMDSINKNNKLAIEDYDILTPLPEEYKLKYYSNQTNKSGFAWVNKFGNLWHYERSINSNHILIKNPDIYELHKKVISRNLIWGVHDYKKAKKSLEQENNNEKLKNEEFNILMPLPQEYEIFFRATKINKSGFAWVNKIGNQWIYSRNLNGSYVKIKDEDIYNLYEKVISQNYVWGVRDINKAKRVLNQEKDNNYAEKNNILVRLAMNDESILDLAERYKSGFAWVRKNGIQWYYSRDINGKQITLKDHNIYKLHEKVISHDLDWGVYDLNKAKKTLNIENNHYMAHDTNQKNIYVNYLIKNDLNVDILIKGTIANDELFTLLSKLKSFEENITRILTNKINNKIDILIEMDLNTDLLSQFEKDIGKLGWIIN